jgi:hypothetical protein
METEVAFFEYGVLFKNKIGALLVLHVSMETEVACFEYCVLFKNKIGALLVLFIP